MQLTKVKIQDQKLIVHENFILTKKIPAENFYRDFLIPDPQLPIRDNQDFEESSSDCFAFQEADKASINACFGASDWSLS